MSNSAGSFIWYELMTSDSDAARDFYRAAIGWEIGEPVEGPVDYRHIRRSDAGDAGGVLALSAEMVANGARPCWLPYLGVPDVDAAVAAITAEGGKLLMPRMTIDVGSFALVSDPQGAPLYVMTPVTPPGEDGYASDVFSETAEQRVGWNEYFAEDLAAAKDLYARHFGFEFNESMPMGPMGDYCFIDHHGVRLGAMMQRPPQAPAQGWRIVFRVPDIDRAHAMVTQTGGTAVTEPHQVPTGDFVFHAFDPQGAFFALVGKRKG